MDDRKYMNCEMDKDVNKESEEFKIIESDITENLNIRDFGLGLELVGYEATVLCGVCDIICSDEDKNLIPIEVKKGCAGDASIGQILGYMKSLKSKYGILLAKTFRKRVVYLATDLNIKLFIYNIEKNDRLKFIVSIYECKYVEGYETEDDK